MYTHKINRMISFSHPTSAVHFSNPSRQLTAQLNRWAKGQQWPQSLQMLRELRENAQEANVTWARCRCSWMVDVMEKSELEMEGNQGFSPILGNLNMIVWDLYIDGIFSGDRNPEW